MEPFLNNLYVYFNDKGEPLGLGIYKGDYIEEIPRTCGCNGINVNDIYSWHYIMCPNSNMILNIAKEEDE